MYAPKRSAPENPGGTRPGLDDPRALESGIRELAASGQNEIGSRSEPPVENLNALVRRVSGTSVEKIDSVILELQAVRDMLRREGDRVSRGIADYASLNQAVKNAMEVIGENLAQWKR
jgi:hypothetical protein